MLPLLIPIVVVELILLAAALIDLSRQNATRGPKWVWALVIVFIQIIGPIVYFVLGRKEE
jgi:hypothetical protein